MPILWQKRLYNEANKTHSSIGSYFPWFSRALSSDFDKFLRFEITLRHLQIPRGDAISGNKTWPFTNRRGHRSLESGFLPRIPLDLSTSISIRSLGQTSGNSGVHCGLSPFNGTRNTVPSLRLSRLLDSKWKMVRDEMGCFPAASRTARFQNVADRLSAR